MKKFKSNTPINIDSLIRNLVIVVKDENEASETIAKKVTEALANVVKAAQV